MPTNTSWFYSDAIDGVKKQTFLNITSNGFSVRGNGTNRTVPTIGTTGSPTGRPGHHRSTWRPGTFLNASTSPVASVWPYAMQVEASQRS